MIIKILIKWVALALILMFVAWVIPGIEVENFWVAMIASVVIALINAIIKPILMFLTLPITVLTLGIFTLVINALLFMFSAYLVPGIEISGFLSAFLGALLLSILSVGIAWL